MKTILTLFLSILICSLCLGQGASTGFNDTKVGYDSQVGFKESVPVAIKADTTSTEYDYFAAYLVIQTSNVTDNQVEFTKKLAKFVKQQHGVLYITIQSGIPPCVPTPTRPCPKT